MSAVAAEGSYTYGTLINGVWVSEGRAFATYNPACPDQQVGHYRESSIAEVAAVMKAASTAQRAWARVPGLERQGIVQAFLAKLRGETERIARAITLEMGKPLAEARGEVGYSLREAEFMASEAARPLGHLLPSLRSNMRNMSMRKPRGVIAAITPWNYPLLTPMRKIAPALTFGNSIVLKPSEFTPATACIVADLARGILPDGLLGIVLGQAAVGQALVSHPLVDAVTFTGSVATGRSIYKLAAQSLAEVSLELGGKNPIVIHDTDDLDACLNEAVTGALVNAGQRCTAISRVLVRRGLAADVEAGLAERMRAVVVGNGFDERTRIGPLAMKAQLEKVNAMVENGVAQGARICAGGERLAPAGFASGYFMAPTLLCGVTPGMTVAREEIFGPVLSVLPYETIDEALDMVNDVQFGLSASLFSNDQRVVHRFIDHANAGMLHINNQTATDPNMPFIGMKDSGVGACSVGQGSANFYTSESAVYLRYGS